MNISPRIIEAKEVERLSADLARRVADLLTEGAYYISPEHAARIEEHNPSGGIWQQWIGYGSSPLMMEFQIQRGGHVRLELRLANGETVWRATLRP